MCCLTSDTTGERKGSRVSEKGDCEVGPYSVSRRSLQRATRTEAL
jgi:hypothetical protein